MSAFETFVRSDGSSLRGLRGGFRGLRGDLR